MASAYQFAYPAGVRSIRIPVMAAPSDQSSTKIRVQPGRSHHISANPTPNTMNITAPSRTICCDRLTISASDIGPDIVPCC